MISKLRLARNGTLTAGVGSCFNTIIHKVVLKLRQLLYKNELVDIVRHPQLEAGRLVYVLDDVQAADASDLAAGCF
jgi:hypothetical protein